MEKRLALPMGKIKVPVFLYWVLFILIILILVIIGFNFVVSKFGKVLKKQSLVKNITPTVVEENTSGGSNLLTVGKRSEMSKKIMAWLEEQRDMTRDVYSESEFCGEDGTCKGNDESNRSGFSVMAGEARYEKKINQHIIDDFKKYSDREKVQVIQSNYLLCNFLYDLYSFPSVDKEVKNLTEKVCFDVDYEIMNDDYNSIYKEDIDVKKLQYQVLQKLKGINDGEENINSVDEDTFKSLKFYGFYVSEFATRYKWKKENEDFKGFLVSLDKFLDLYGNKKNEFRDGEVCGLALGLVDMSEIEGLSEFKNYGESFYKKEVFGDRVMKMSLRQMLTCGLAAEKFEDKDTFNRILLTIMSNFYIKNHGAIGEQFHGYSSNVYDVKNNGIFLMLLNSDIISND